MAKDKRCPSRGFFCFSTDHSQASSQHQVLEFLKTAAYPCMGRKCFLPHLIEINGVCVHSVPLYRSDKYTATNPCEQRGRPGLLGWYLVWVGHWASKGNGSFWIFAVILLISWGTAASLDSLLPGGRDASKTAPWQTYTHCLHTVCLFISSMTNGWRWCRGDRIKDLLINCLWAQNLFLQQRQCGIW